MATQEWILDTEAFHGPLDLLLYLVDRQEVDLRVISLQKVIRQFKDFLEILAFLEVTEVSGYVATLAKLLEQKSTLILPPEVEPEGEEEEAPLEEFKDNLFQQLAEYRRVREAAKKLLELAASSGKRHPRPANWKTTDPFRGSALPARVGRLEIWDLVSAFGRLMREIDPDSIETVSADPTPLSQVVDQVKARLIAEGPLTLRALYTLPRTRARLISLFLAILELARHHGALLRQDDWMGDVVVWMGTPEELATGDGKPQE